MSAAINSEVRSFVEVGENQPNIESTESLVILGLKFGSKPTVSAHIDFIKQKYYARAWLICHLKAASVPLDNVATIFATTIRPVLEYAAAVYHPFLTAKQSDELKSLQRRSLKVVYGHRVSYRDALTKANLPTLAHRRELILEKIAGKLEDNHLFQR